jgi:hypothetical protein
MSKFKLHDGVLDLAWGVGYILSIDIDSTPYPVKVQFSGEVRSYTAEGKEFVSRAYPGLLTRDEAAALGYAWLCNSYSKAKNKKKRKYAWGYVEVYNSDPEHRKLSGFVYKSLPELKSSYASPSPERKYTKVKVYKL